MKVVQINPVCYASTGKIAVEISKLLDAENIENYILYTSGNSNFKNSIKYANDKIIKFNALLAKVKGNYGFNSKIITKRLILKLKKIKPDVIHLHNLHGHNVNLKLLFTYLKSIDVKIVWTFHDSWSFTGYCTYYDYPVCYKWKTGCGNCPQVKRFSWFLDKSLHLYNKKRKLFTGFKDMTIVTPSKWLAEFSKISFFGEYPIEVINNGIDTELFKPTESNFRERYGLVDKKILLGVAMGFDRRKGLNSFIELSKIIADDMHIVLVGVSKKQIETLPGNITGIERTANQVELAKVYTAADVFVNCTYEDNFPTVNLEALACGIPVVTFDTGGSKEAIDETCGSFVEKGDVVALYKEICRIFEEKNIKENCIKRAKNNFSSEPQYRKYLEIYRRD